jgi:hypothetical protein
MKRGLLVAVGVPFALVTIVLFLTHVGSALLFAAGAVSIGFAFTKYEAGVTIRNRPTAKARSAAIGLAELSGRARCDAPTVSPITQTPSAMWYAVVERYERRNSKERWKELLSRLDYASIFEIEDDTGRMLLWPADADLKFASLRKWRSKDGPPPASAAPILETLGVSWPDRRSRNPVRMSEICVRDGDPLYVIGTLMERGQIDASRREPPKGSWAAQVLEAFEPLHPPEVDSGRVVIWKGHHGVPFILADSEQQALNGMRREIWLPLAFGVFFTVFSLFTLF